MKKVILDVDTGVDDALAIMLAVTNPGVEVLAITCTAGNTSLENAVRNTARVLQECDRKIPIYKGAPRRILGVRPNLQPVRFVVHGKDGLGDADFKDSVDTSLIQSEHAVNAIIRIVKEHSGEVTLITLGPLTNVALAFVLAPDLSDHIQNIYIMGGNTDGDDPDLLKEFNFCNDPEAAFITLEHMKGKAIIQSRDVTDDTVFSKEWFAEALEVDTPKSRFIAKIIQYRLDSPSFLNIRIPDFLLMASFIDPETVTKIVTAHATVTLRRETCGLLDIEWDTETPNVKLYMEMSVDRIKEIFKKLLKLE